MPRARPGQAPSLSVCEPCGYQRLPSAHESQDEDLGSSPEVFSLVLDDLPKPPQNIVTSSHVWCLGLSMFDTSVDKSPLSPTLSSCVQKPRDTYTKGPYRGG